MSESNSALGAMQGQWAASKTGVEINNGIETVYQCHCLVTGRRMRESCLDMDEYTYHHLGNNVGRERVRNRSYGVVES